MDRTGKVIRKLPSPEALKTTSALYDRKGNLAQTGETTETANLEHIAYIMERLSALYGRIVETRVLPGEIAFSDEDGELVRISAVRALSMVEDIRFLLSPVLDRKA